MPDTAPLRVAILGGGLAGIFLFRGLRQHAHLDVHVFESRAAFLETGAGIGLSTNATSALHHMDPAIITCLDAAGAVKPKDTDHFIATGPHTGLKLKPINRPEGADRRIDQRTCARQPLLTELLRDVPRSQLHAGKRLAEILDHPVKPGEGRYVLVFEDGSREEFDLVVGADGIHGLTRRFVLGEDPSVEPVSAGVCLLPMLVPYARVKEFLEPVLDHENHNQSSWIGEGVFMLFDLHDNAETVQIAAMIRTADRMGQKGVWKEELSKEAFRERFRSMPPHVSKGAVEAMCDLTEDSAMAFFNINNHVDTPTYIKGRVLLIGDAAHATSPAMASGGGMSAEDACILSALLGKVRTLKDAEVAFKVFDGVRRPRCERIVTASRNIGQVMCGSIGLDPETLDDNIAHAWDFIQLWRPDVEVPSALEMYISLL